MRNRHIIVTLMAVLIPSVHTLGAQTLPRYEIQLLGHFSTPNNNNIVEKWDALKIDRVKNRIEMCGVALYASSGQTPTLAGSCSTLPFANYDGFPLTSVFTPFVGSTPSTGQYPAFFSIELGSGQVRFCASNKCVVLTENSPGDVKPKAK